MMPIDIKEFTFTAAEREVIRCLFMKGPTWDGNIPDKNGRGNLVKRGYAEHNFGYAWLTEKGVEYAVKIMNLDKT